MEYVERINFLDKLLPHGEDSFSFDYGDGNLLVEISYDEKTKCIQLKFEGCSYQYFAPIPGYHPEKLQVDFRFKSSCVYELQDTELLTKSKAFYQNPAYQPNLRHFFLYLEWENVALHVIATSVQFDDGPIEAEHQS